MANLLSHCTGIVADILVASVLLLGCATNRISAGSSDCNDPASQAESQAAVSTLSINVPEGWEVGRLNQSYFTTSSNPASILYILVFQRDNTTPRSCLEESIKGISQHGTDIDRYSFQPIEIAVDGQPADVVFVDGHSSSGGKLPTRGIYVGFARGDWIYLFMWDSFGTSDRAPLADTVRKTLQTVRFAR